MPFCLQTWIHDVRKPEVFDSDIRWVPLNTHYTTIPRIYWWRAPLYSQPKSTETQGHHIRNVSFQAMAITASVHFSLKVILGKWLQEK